MMLLACVLAWPLAGAAVLVGVSWALSMLKRRRDVRHMHEARRDPDAMGVQPTRPWPRA